MRYEIQNFKYDITDAHGSLPFWTNTLRLPETHKVMVWNSIKWLQKSSIPHPTLTVDVCPKNIIFDGEKFEGVIYSNLIILWIVHYHVKY